MFRSSAYYLNSEKFFQEIAKVFFFPFKSKLYMTHGPNGPPHVDPPPPRTHPVHTRTPLETAQYRLIMIQLYK